MNLQRSNVVPRFSFSFFHHRNTRKNPVETFLNKLVVAFRFTFEENYKWRFQNVKVAAGLTVLLLEYEEKETPLSNLTIQMKIIRFIWNRHNWRVLISLLKNTYYSKTTVKLNLPTSWSLTNKLVGGCVEAWHSYRPVSLVPANRMCKAQSCNKNIIF